jgi:F0F1-type ATP synthase delta subunit
MSNQTMISKIVDPYAQALISFKVNPKKVLVLLDILYLCQNHFLSPRVSTLAKKNMIYSFRGSFDPFLLRLCIIILDREKPELLCPTLERYIQLCNMLSRVASLKITTTVPLTTDQKNFIVSELIDLSKLRHFIVKNVVDSRIYGGVIFETPTTVLNITIKDRLKAISNYLF